MMVEHIVCGNCHCHCSNETMVSKLNVSNDKTNEVIELNVGDALAFIYGISWTAFSIDLKHDYSNSDLLQTNNFIISDNFRDSTRCNVELCLDCSELLKENYKIHTSFENRTHDESIVLQAKQFRAKSNNKIQQSPSNNDEDTNIFTDFNFGEENENSTDSQSADFQHHDIDIKPYVNIPEEISEVEDKIKLEVSNRIIKLKTLRNQKSARKPRKKKSDNVSLTVLKMSKLKGFKPIYFGDTPNVDEQGELRNVDDPNFDSVSDNNETESIVKCETEITENEDVRDSEMSGCLKSRLRNKGIYSAGKTSAEKKKESSVVIPTANNQKANKVSSKKNENKRMKTKASKECVSGPGKYICEICGKGTKNWQALRNHRRKCHNKAACHICGKIYPKSYLNTHIRDRCGNKEDKMKSCEICGKRVKGADMRVHMKIHAESRENFPCDFCDKSFLRAYSLKEHMQVHVLGKLQCSICDKKFDTKLSLATHKKTHDTTLALKFACQFCGRKFREKAGLKSHLYSHSEGRDFVCDQCGKSFKYPQHLKDHLRCHKELNEGDKTFDCDLCLKQFRTSLNLYKHKQRLHRSHMKIFQCTSCGKRLAPGSSATDMKRHEAIHTRNLAKGVQGGALKKVKRLTEYKEGH